MLGNYCN